MKKRFLVLCLAVLLLLLAAAFLGGVFDSGPSFQGKSARRWAQGLRFQSVPEGEVMEAFKKMGTNSIPMLLHEIQREEPGWRNRHKLKPIPRINKDPLIGSSIGSSSTLWRPFRSPW